VGKVTALDEIKKTEALIIDEQGASANLEIEGNRNAQAFSYPALLAAAGRIEVLLEKIHAQLAEITGDEDPL